jgi:hypothetical protein
MSQLVLIKIAVQETGYSAPHISLLLRKGLVQGEKIGGIWLVDLKSLKAYIADMNELGNQKFDPTKNK